LSSGKAVPAGCTTVFNTRFNRTTPGNWNDSRHEIIFENKNGGSGFPGPPFEFCSGQNL
jgi:hypothetical protein